MSEYMFHSYNRRHGPYLIEGHQFLSIHFFRLVQRSEGNVLWRQSSISKRSFDGIQVMGTDSDECPLSCEVLVKLVLQGHEGIVSCWVEFHIAQNCTGDVRPNFHSLSQIISPHWCIRTTA